jgi:hypothetical protein
MIKGDMRLDIMEKNVLRQIPIREGEFFLLPARIPHSPQVLTMLFICRTHSTHLIDSASPIRLGLFWSVNACPVKPMACAGP